VTFDLTGLPPTPAEIEAFLADASPEAFTRVVDRLLGSPRYGERWGRHWLDVARYADSNGLDENIAHGNAWRYRDYVVQSLNRDTPWPRFVREQLAADRFYPEASHLTPALGFLGAGTLDLSTRTVEPVVFDYLDRGRGCVRRALTPSPTKRSAAWWTSRRALDVTIPSSDTDWTRTSSATAWPRCGTTWCR
jgi:hypothetical protein